MLQPLHATCYNPCPCDGPVISPKDDKFFLLRFDRWCRYGVHAILDLPFIGSTDAYLHNSRNLARTDAHGGLLAEDASALAHCQALGESRNLSRTQ